MVSNSPSRNNSEITDNSASAGYSQSSFADLFKFIHTLDEHNKPVCAIYEKSSPPPSIKSVDGHFFKWKNFRPPLRSLLKKGINMIRPRSFHGEKHPLPWRTNDRDTPYIKSDLFLTAGQDDSIGILSSQEFGQILVSTPTEVPVFTNSEGLLLGEGSDLDLVHDNGKLTVHPESNSSSFDQAAPHSPSVSSYRDDKPPQVPHDLPGSCIVAELALLHATSREVELRKTLTSCGYEGSYFIQVGFSSELLGSNHGFLQEIYIFLEHEVHPGPIETIATALYPFPIVIYTPDAIHHHPFPQDEEDMWDLWALHGIFRSEIKGQKTIEVPAPSDAADNLEHPADSSNGDHSGGHGHSDGSTALRGNSGKGSGGGGGRDDGNVENNQDGDEDEDEGGGIESIRVEVHPTDDYNTREVSIPFSSTITLPGGTRQSFSRYNTNACIDIRIEDNPDSQSPPPGLNWGGPWLETKFTLLDAEIQVAPQKKVAYHLGLSQIRIMTSGCDVSYLAYSPKVIRVDEDDVKAAIERERSIGGRVTLGAAPNVRLDGSVGHTSNEERSQNRWEVSSHRLPADTNHAGERRKTIMWKYTHNDKFYTPEPQNDFEPKPSATFGFSPTSSGLPKLEVEVVTNYSWTAPAQTLRDWVADISRSKPKKTLPAYSNFLHQVSVGVDLNHVKSRTEWVIGLDPEDRYEVSDINRIEPVPIFMPLENKAGVSDCTVLLKRGLYGQICLTEEERENHRNNPLPWPLAASAQNRHSVLEVGGLPTPSSSQLSINRA